MTLEELQIKYDFLIERVRIMRRFQSEWAKHYCSSDKEAMKRLQRQVDGIIEVETKRIKSGQKELGLR